MTTWQNIKSVLTTSENFRGEVVNDSLVKVLINTDAGRSQIVFVGTEDNDLIYNSAVCPINDVNLDGLFKADFFPNFKYGVGSSGDYFVLKHVTPIEDVDAKELLTPLLGLAYHADLLEKLITGGDAF